MALPMVHLIAAWNWVQDKPTLIDRPEFYLGVIAPDAIHIRDGHDKSHKDDIHYFNWKTSNPDQIVEYWRNYKNPFDIGYGIHVLLDGLWTDRFRDRLKGMLLPNGKPDPDIYYNDTIISDFLLYQSFEQRKLIFGLIEQADVPCDHPKLTGHEICEWRKLVCRKFYAAPCPKRNPARFVTMSYINEFLQNCGILFDRVYAASGNN